MPNLHKKLSMAVLPLSLALATLACLTLGGDAQQEVEEEPGAGAVRLDYDDLGLNSVDAYASTFDMAFTPEDGSSDSWTYTSDTLALDKSTTTRRDISIDGVDPSQDLGDVTLTLVGDTQYMTGQAVGLGCFLFPASVELETSVLSPDDFLSPADLSRVLERAGDERVAGQTGTRYTFEADALADFTDLSGELVLANTRGYVLRYDFAGDTEDTLFTGGQPGRLTWHFEITDLAPEEDIAVPDDCAIEYPLMADATDVARLPGMIVYKSSSGTAAVVAFYEETLPADGWDVYNFPATREEATVLTYARGGEVLSVSVSPDDGGSEVRLFLEDTP